MVRRTKEQALVTRDCILDAAELLFEAKGVSRTTLHNIAEKAGVTRGAIYWHFEDKSALFTAMMDRATTPLEAVLQATDAASVTDPLQDVRCWLQTLFDLTANDAKTRRVFEIITHKIEYVDELTGVRDRHVANTRQWLAQAEARLHLAIARGILKSDLPAQVVARTLLGLASGLIHMWLLDPESFDLVQTGSQAVDDYLNYRRVSPDTHD